MAQVATTVNQHAELLLAHLLEVWQDLAWVAAEIERWDPGEQIDFIEEWPTQEQSLQQLERYAAEEGLTPEQLARYEDLQRLVARNRPIIRRLQAG